MAPELRPRPGWPTLKEQYRRGDTAVRRAAAHSSSTDARLPVLQYQQLNLVKREIRILRLLPGNPTAPVVCELYTAILDDRPRYEALSYAWGLPHFTHSIVLNGRAAAIAANLYNALRRLRRRRHDRHLWVDALCINQADDREKSHQVNLMKEIYSRTVQATLWLGDFSDTLSRSSSSRRSSGHNSRLEPNASSAANTIPRETARAAFKLLSLMARNDHFHDRNDLEATKKNLAALDTMLRLPWWHRIWTVQEAILPSEAVIQCGTAKMPLRNLYLAYKSSSHHDFDGCCSNLDNVLFGFWNQIHSILFLKAPDPHVEKVISALNLFRNRQASDPRDRVYALVGLGSTLSVDYSLSHEEVYKRSVRSLIVESGGLEPLLRVSEEVRRSSSLPTWVPDFGTGLDQVVFDAEMAWLYIYPYFTASLRTKPVTRNPASDHVLELEGFTVDKLVALGDLLSDTDDAPHVVARWQEIVSAHCAVRGEDYPRRGTYHDAFWRTILADIITSQGDYRRATADDESVARKAWDLATFNSGTELHLWKRTRLFLTRDGLIGLGQGDMQVGDSVHVLFGGNMPFILRGAGASSHDGSQQFHYVGQAYVHGIMDGEVLDEGREREVINLV